MSYNAHACRGTDGRLDIQRVADVILQEDPDVVTLQELDVDDPRSDGIDQPARLAELTNRQVHFHAARSAAHVSFGNATLCRFPFEIVSQGSLPAYRDEARAAHCLRISLDDTTWVDFLNTHLSIRFRERLAQVRAIFEEGDPISDAKEIFSPLVAPFDHLVLCGDLNAGGWSPVVRWLRGRLRDVQKCTRGRPRATWPSQFPILRLDHIWVGPNIEVRAVRVPRTPLSKRASDHLPLVADLRVPSSTSSVPIGATLPGKRK